MSNILNWLDADFLMHRGLSKKTCGNSIIWMKSCQAYELTLKYKEVGENSTIVEILLEKNEKSLEFKKEYRSNTTGEIFSKDYHRIFQTFELI